MDYIDTIKEIVLNIIESFLILGIFQALYNRKKFVAEKN